MLLDECKPAGCLSCLWFASNRSEPGFPCKCYNMQMAPEGVASAKGPAVIGSPWLARCSRYYLRHDDAKWPDFAERQR